MPQLSSEHYSHTVAAAAASVETSSMAPLAHLHRAAQSWGASSQTVQDVPAPTRGNLDLAHDDSTEMSKALVRVQRNDFQALGETSVPSCLHYSSSSQKM